MTVTEERKIRIVRHQEPAAGIVRTAPYCRVSSDSEDQLLSYAAQVDYYKELIDANREWVLVDIYADEGLTGTKTDKRDDFHRLVADCRRGKIDRVIVKSVSRFARNTQDCLEYVRLLKSFGVSVYFEREQIDTATMKDELQLTVNGMMAQEESLSISGNMRWSYKRRMESGAFNCCRAAYGFSLIDGELVINEEEAEVVRRIFDMYLSGIGKQTIANILNAESVTKRNGKSTWSVGSISCILNNERYMGDAILQKRYTSNTFPFSRMINHGEMPQYYVENSNSAIIGHEIFGAAQNLQKSRKNQFELPIQKTLNKKLTCIDCGSYYRRKISNDKPYWICTSYANGKTACNSIHLAESSIYYAYLILLNKLAVNRKHVISPVISQMAQMQIRSGGVGSKIYTVDKQIADLSTQNHALSQLHTAGILDAADFRAKSGALSRQIASLRTERKILIREDEYEETIADLKELDEILSSVNGIQTEFDEEIFKAIVLGITPLSNRELRFRLLGGLEFTEAIDTR
jgi:DNA invertase Pin-like site-specific DNA recombinase